MCIILGMMVNVLTSVDADGLYGLVPQRLIDEEDEKLQTWRQDTDLVTCSDILFICNNNLNMATVYVTSLRIILAFCPDLNALAVTCKSILATISSSSVILWHFCNFITVTTNTLMFIFR